MTIAKTEIEGRKGYWHLDEDVEAIGHWIPKAMIWDLATKPPWIRWAGYRADDERTIKASLCHDFFYLLFNKSVTRSYADKCYREQAIRDGYPKRKAWTEWAAIRAFGGSHWGNNKEDEKLISEMINNWRNMGGKYLDFAMNIHP
jgi:hypothetical protein